MKGKDSVNKQNVGVREAMKLVTLTMRIKYFLGNISKSYKGLWIYKLSLLCHFNLCKSKTKINQILQIVKPVFSLLDLWKTDCIMFLYLINYEIRCSVSIQLPALPASPPLGV